MASNSTSFNRQHWKILNFRVIRELMCRSLSSETSRINYKKCLSRCHHEVILRSRDSLCVRHVSTSRGQPSSVSGEETKKEKQPIHPYRLVEREITGITDRIKQELFSSNPYLRETAEYYFDGKGKAFRPMLVMLVAKAFNFHVLNDERLNNHQQQIAMIAEMIHTASLMHDDVIDHADTRRGKPSINCVWGQRKSILAGDYVMGMASISLSRIGNPKVVSIVSQIIEDLVRGEFMQLGSKENENERFNHYLTKTFKKTASLLANSCKAVAVLGHCGEELSQMAFEYGRNVGISFQLIDDLLDFTSCDQVMGKPTAADLRLGLATAPVLFAASKHSELNAMIMRRFREEGDVEKAREYVAQSNGVEETRILAEQHSKEAIKVLKSLRQSDSLQALHNIADLVLNRNK